MENVLLDNSRETSPSKFPELNNPPSGLKIIRPLVIDDGQTAFYGGTANVYQGIDNSGKEVVIKIARDGSNAASNIGEVQSEFQLLTYRLPRTFFSPFRKEPVFSNLKIESKLSDYNIGGKYADYDINVRLVKPIEELTSKEMLAAGQIVLGKAKGEPLVDVKSGEINTNIPPEIHAAVVLAYVDFCVEVASNGVFLDSNFDTDLIINIDDEHKKVDVTRVDVTREKATSNASFIAGKISSIYGRDLSLDHVAKYFSPDFVNIYNRFKSLPDIDKTLPKLKDLILENGPLRK